MNAASPGDVTGLLCAHCGAMLLAEASFCRNCGAPARPSDAATNRPQVPDFLEPLLAPGPRDGGGATALAAALADHLSGVDSPHDTVRGARFLLGRALLAADRPKKARAMLAECRTEEGNRPPDKDILLAVALGKLGDGTLDAALHDVFEALQADPAPLPNLIEVLLESADPQTIRPLSGWLVDTWRPAMLAAYPDGPAAAGASVLAAACRLLEWRIDDFAALARASVELSGPDVATGLWGRILRAPGFAEAVREPAGPAGPQLAAALLARLFDRQDTALRLVDDALTTTFPDGEYKEADAYRLRAELRLEGGEPEPAATDFLEAGKNFSWRDGTGDLDRAADCLRRSIEHAASAEAHWHLAHLQLRRAYVPTPPYADPALLNDAVEQWQRGRDLAAPNADSAWAYWTRADILRSQAYVEPDRTTELMWQLWDATERWLVLVGETRADLSSVALATLSEVVSSFGLKVLGAHLIRKALRMRDAVGDLGDWDHAVLRQHLVVAYSFAPDAFEAAMDAYAEAAGADVNWLDGVRASYLAQLGQLAEALPLFEKAIEANLDAAWMREHYACALARSDRVEDALAQYAQVVELSEPGGLYAGPNSAAVRATALCHLGRTDEAVELVRDLLAASVPFSDPAESTALLVMCYLRAGDFDAAEATAARLTAEPVTAALLRNLERDLHLTADLAVRDGADPEVLKKADAIAGSVVSTATAAAYTEDPSAALDELLRETDRLMSAGQAEWPLRARQATLFLEVAGLTDLRGSDTDADVVVPARLTFAASLGAAAETAAEWIDDFLAILRKLDSSDPVHRLVDLWAQTVNTAPELARSAVRITGDRESFDKTLGEDCVTRLTALLAERSAELLTSQESGLAAEAPARVVLRIGSELLPGAAESWQEWPMFAEYIPAMREAIKADTGVHVPGVRVFEALPDRQYAVTLDDLELVEGSVPPDEPDPSKMMIAAVEREIRAHLPEFVGVDLVGQLLAEWQRLPDLEERVAPYLADAVALVRLTRTVRTLVAAGTPVGEPGPVLAAAEESGATSREGER